jgi:hypothetical protein
VLRENEYLLVYVFLFGEDLAQLFELRLRAALVYFVGQTLKLKHLFLFSNEVSQGRHNDTLEQGVFCNFVFLCPVFGTLLIGRLRFENIVVFLDSALESQELLYR